MAWLFVGIFDFFRKNKIIFWIFQAAVFLFLLFFALKIDLEEDITRFIPANRELGQINSIFENLKARDKLIIHLSQQDTLAEPDPDKLTAWADIFVDSVKATLYPHYVKNISAKVSDETMLNAYQIIYNHLPSFLDSSDYQKIDSLILEKQMDSTLAFNYRQLVSPTGMVMKKFIINDPLGISYIVMNKLRKLQVDDSFELHNGYIVSRDKRHLMLFLSSAFPSIETKQNAVLLDRINEIFGELNTDQFKGVSAEYYGGIAVSVGNAKQLKTDTMMTLSVALLLLVIFFSFFYRRIEVVLFVMMPVIFGAVFSLALLYFFKSTVSAIAVGSGSVILGIAINYALHFFTHLKHKGTIRETIGDLANPMILGSTTTIGAFLSLLFTKSEALQDFGLFSAFSLLGSALFTLVFLPQFISTKTDWQREGRLQHFIDNLTSYRFERNRKLFLVLLFATVILAWFSGKVKFEEDLTKINFAPENVKTAEKNLSRISDVTLKAVYLVSSGKSLDEALQKNEKVIPILNKLTTESRIKKYTPVSSVIFSGRMQNRRIAQWKKYWSEGKRDSLRKALPQLGSKYGYKPDAFKNFQDLLDREPELLSPVASDSLKNLFLGDLVFRDAGEYVIITQMMVDEKDKQTVMNKLQGQPGVFVFDRQYISTLFVDMISDDFNLILAISSALVFLFLLLTYGRIELAIISFLPMLVSWFWILGIMGITDIRFNIINIIISTFIFGLGDDFSIFIMDGMLTETKYNKTNLSSYKTSVFLSGTTMLIGIGVLIFAGHPALKSIALVTIIGMLSVILVSFTIAPLVYRWIFFNGNKRRSSPLTLYGILYAFVCYFYFAFGGFTVLTTGFLFKLIPFGRKQLNYFYHLQIMYVCRTTMYVMYRARKKIIYTVPENFRKPALIICNHQSHIDIPLVLMFTPKVIALTNKWVWNSPFVGNIVKMADFYNISDGVENSLERMESRLKEGYSIIVFPEGTRAEDKVIKRFHKGAFYLAEKFKLDILPMVMNGTGDYVGKSEFFGQPAKIAVKWLPRIVSEDKSFGENYAERAKMIGRYFRKEYASLVKEEYSSPDLYRPKLINNYLYRGPILEWYLRVKLMMEKNYKQINTLVPENAVVCDIGCGYGFISYMLYFVSEKRKITGLDYDAEKISVAANAFYNNKDVNFVCSDALSYKYEAADVFLISDVLHYMTFAQQEQLLETCISKLNSDGVIIIRDGDADEKKGHNVTKLSEKFSTGTGFNKTRNALCFTSFSRLKLIAEKNNMQIQKSGLSGVSSNTLFVMYSKK